MISDIRAIRRKLAATAQSLARKYENELKRQKADYAQLERPDFLWHYLLQSFATMFPEAYV